MLKPINHCPLCDGRLEPVKLRCSACDMTMEGRLPVSKLALLAAEQQQFVEAFLVARGNIKEVEKELGISYPTVRKRLDEVVQALTALGVAPSEALAEVAKLPSGSPMTLEEKVTLCLQRLGGG